jgi:endonuclease-3
MSPETIHEVFARFSRLNPHPQTELYYTNPYTLLVAVTLSAQATDVGVNKVTRSLFQHIDTPYKMVDFGEEKLKESIKTIGLFNTKARNIIAAAQILVGQFGGQVPEIRKDLESLPGVGRKTANVILNTVFEHPIIAVDTHVFRVANRLGLAHGTTPLAVETQLEKVIPSEFMYHAHHWLVLHGRYICKAPKPLCNQCPLYDLCEYSDKTA